MRGSLRLMGKCLTWEGLRGGRLRDMLRGERSVSAAGER